MATFKEVQDYIQLLTQTSKDPVTGILKIEAASPLVEHRKASTGVMVNPRYILERVITKFGLDSSEARALKTNDTKKHQDLSPAQWSSLVQFIPLNYSVDQLPLIIDGKEVSIKANDASQAIIDKIQSKAKPVVTLGDAIDNARALSGEAPKTNNTIARIGLGVLCAGGLAFLIHHSKNK